jgi:predicted nucleic acid-binding protein
MRRRDPVTVVIDTSVWVAAFVPTDVNHADASELIQRVLNGDIKVLLPNSVLTV